VSQAEIVTLYPHRSEIPKHLWLDLLMAAKKRVWLYANASLFLPEDNPDSIEIIRRKAKDGAEVRIMMADPDSTECVVRGVEERLFEAIPARVNRPGESGDSTLINLRYTISLQISIE
jgi:hypothetical protein